MARRPIKKRKQKQEKLLDDLNELNNVTDDKQEEDNDDFLKRMDLAINQVVDTFDFNGIKIDNMDINEKGIPTFKISVSKSKRKKTLDDTLNFAYWALWTLIYGEYTEDKSKLELNLDYLETE